MKKNAKDFYLLFCSSNFRNITETIQEGFSGMYYVLKILSDSNFELSAGDISNEFGVSTARTAVILNTLERKGYITKSKSNQDGRKTIVLLTEAGNNALQIRKNKILSVLNTYINKLSEQETDKLYFLLEKILSNN